MYRIHLQPYIQQVKMLNNMYGAACDHQYMLTAMPPIIKQVKISRRPSDESPQQTELGRVQDFTQLAGIFTASSSVHNMPEEGARRRRGRRRRHSKQSTGSGRGRSPLRVFETSVVDVVGSDMNQKRAEGAGVCEECGGPLHLPRANIKKEKCSEKDSNRGIHGVGSESQRKPDENAPSILGTSHGLPSYKDPTG